MNLLIWNSRGTGSQSFPNLIHELRKFHCLDFVALLETRCSGDNAKRIINKLGFKHSAIVEADGFKGGIWCMWSDKLANLEVVEKNAQFIHFKVIDQKQLSWFMTIVYASPSPAKRRELWRDLIDVGSRVNLPWCLGGDFNATLLDTERKSKARCRKSFDREFCRWADDMGVCDIGFEGPPLTWKRGTSEARLDRFVANEAWVEKFMDAKVYSTCLSLNLIIGQSCLKLNLT